MLRAFVPEEDSGLEKAKRVVERFPRMVSQASEAGLPVRDIEHMRDLMEIVLLARRYIFGPPGRKVEEEIIRAKRAYKDRWPKSQRYRIRLSLGGGGVPGGVLQIARRVLLRGNRDYRVTDRWFVLPLLGAVYRSVRRCSPDSLPKFLRKSAMGVDVVLK